MGKFCHFRRNIHSSSNPRKIIHMSRNSENGGACGRVCSSCSSCISNFRFFDCILTFLVLTLVHFVRSSAIILSAVLVNISWILFEGTLSVAVFVYSIALILCVFITFIKPQGSWNEKMEKNAREEKRKQKQSRREAQQQNQRRQGRQGARQHIESRQGGLRVHRPPIHHIPEGADQPPAEPLGNTMEQRQSAPAKCMRTTVEITAEVHAAESRDSRNDIEPTSTSSNEPLQQPTHSNSSSNLPSTSADQSTKSTPIPLDDVSNEELPDEELLEQAAPSNLE